MSTTDNLRQILQPKIIVRNFPLSRLSGKHYFRNTLQIFYSQYFFNAQMVIQHVSITQATIFYVFYDPLVLT